jgi:hypothetical protein
MDRWDWLPSSTLPLWAAPLQSALSVAEKMRHVNLGRDPPPPARLYNESAPLGTNTTGGIVASYATNRRSEGICARSREGSDLGNVGQHARCYGFLNDRKTDPRPQRSIVSRSPAPCGQTVIYNPTRYWPLIRSSAGIGRPGVTSSFVTAATNQRPSRRTRSQLSMPCWGGMGNPVIAAS